MGKVDAHAQGRMEGIRFALKIVEEEGVEGLKKEVEFRGYTGLHTALSRKQLDEASEKIKNMTFDTVLAMSLFVLRDEFGFANKRLQRFIDRFVSKAECMVGGLATWKDYLETLKEETGIELEIRWND